MSLHFDVVHGQVHLPNDLLIGPSLTQTHLLRVCTEKAIAIRPYTIHSAPYTWFSADGGILDEEPLGVELRFWDDVLVSADLHLDRGGESLDFVRTKRRHDALLKGHLGEPHELWDERQDNAHSVRLFPVYRYSWGKITSLQDGPVFIRLEYAGRRKAAETKFNRVNVPEQLSAVERFRQGRF
ncbi:hypothetical protein [Armatimonas sp.]|uniref:hypothetical protein n=1 Tax=Armatimonas sp. TaxID=1872638 RepID=UPI00286A63C5|nr:hypothetical protein [Armatimonas sp.]